MGLVLFVWVGGGFGALTKKVGGWGPQVYDEDGMLG